MKTPILIIAITFFCTGYVYSQNDSTELNKIEFGLYFNLIVPTYANNDTTNYNATQLLISFYPYQHRNLQLGFSSGLEIFSTEFIEISNDTSITFNELRLPLLLNYKLDLGFNEQLHLKSKFGIALPMTSSLIPSLGEKEPISREEVKIPVLFSFIFGVSLLHSNNVNIQLELGYGFKQLSYTGFTHYSPHSLELGLVGSLR